jgi:hypothetical protein
MDAALAVVDRIRALPLCARAPIGDHGGAQVVWTGDGVTHSGRTSHTPAP